MSTILESVNTLSEKLGVTEREQTIKDQLDLCVERLGGEGNSKDIAESAEKFAEKEDGTATFTTKTITENGTYNASADDVSGYSSVTVNVAAMFSTLITYTMNYASDSAIRVMFCRSTDGNYEPPHGVDYPLQITLLDPAIKVIAAAPGMTITFTPDENFDDFYSVNGNKMTYTGDTVVPGDGKVYRFICTMSGNTMLKTDADFSFIID